MGNNFFNLLNIAVNLMIICLKFGKRLQLACAATSDPVYGEGGTNGRSEEADALSEISFGLQMKALGNFLGEGRVVRS